MRTNMKSANEYAAYLSQVRPRLIQSDEEADAVQELLDSTFDKPNRTEDDRQFIAFLGRLILAWETGKYPPIESAPLDILHSLIEENGLKQRTLVGPVFPTDGIASEVIRGKRKLTYEFVERLSQFFHVSPSLFFPHQSP